MQGKEKEAYERLGWYVDVFGHENFFIELQEHSIPELVQVNKTLVPWADKFGLQLVATNDVHYVREAGWRPARRAALRADGRHRSAHAEPHAHERRLLFPQEPRSRWKRPSAPSSTCRASAFDNTRAHRRDVRGGPGRPDLSPARPAHPRRLHLRNLSAPADRRGVACGSTATAPTIRCGARAQRTRAARSSTRWASTSTS